MKAKKRCKSICRSRKAGTSETVLLIAFGVLFVGVPFLVYMRIAYIGAKSIEFQKEYYANDLGLMTDTIYAVPGGVNYEYRKDPSRFIIDFRKPGVFVYTLIESASKDKMDLGEMGKVGVDITTEGGKLNVDFKEAVYTYKSDPSTPFVKAFRFPATLSFRKKGSILQVSSTGVFEELKSCPDIDTGKDLKEAGIIIDPGHSGQDPGYRSGHFREADITAAIADSLAVLCRSHGIRCTVLAQEDMESKTKQAGSAEPKPDMIISIHAGSYANPEDIPFRATYVGGFEKGSKLACLMEEKFMERYPVLPTETITLKFIQKGDPMALLSDRTPSIHLLIGNINSQKAWGNSDINEIAGMILNAVKEYYRIHEESAEETAEEDSGGAAQQGNIRVIVQ